MRLEYCTVLRKTVCEWLDASDCIFAGIVQKDHPTLNPPPQAGCIRYSRLPKTAMGAVAVFHCSTARPLFFALRDHADRVRRQELEHAQRMLARGENPQEVMELMARALTNKFLHNPSHALSHASGEDRTQLESALRRLYHIHQN